MVFSQPLKGDFKVPGDKSISHRVLMLSAMAGGKSTIRNLANNQDVQATRRCLEQMGVAMAKSANGEIEVQGGWPWQKPAERLNCANSATTMRLLAGILCGQPFNSCLLGDSSLRSRPMRRIIEPLRKMGARIDGVEYCAPLMIAPAEKLLGITYALPVASAQVKSALLLAGLSAEGEVRLTEPHPSRDHTERLMRFMGCHIDTIGSELVLASSQRPNLQGQVFDIPGDPSSAAFLIVVAACTPGSAISVSNVCLNPGRIGMFKLLEAAGASIEYDNVREQCGEPVGDVWVTGSTLQGDWTVGPDLLPSLIDEIPILTVASLFLKGNFTVYGATELRHKESDRIETMATELQKLGVALHVSHDGFSAPTAAHKSVRLPDHGGLSSHGDHRIALALMALNRILDTVPWQIEGAEWAGVSFPEFQRMVFENE